jgi:hypothetical protein
LKRSLVFTLLFLLVGCASNEESVNDHQANATQANDEQVKVSQEKPIDYTLITNSEEEDIFIHAKEMDGLYRDFKIEYKGGTIFKPFWENTVNPVWLPQINHVDINGDGKEELIIILTLGEGTGAIEQEAHVFHIEDNNLIEVLVDHPVMTILKNVRSTLTTEKVEIKIADTIHEVDLKPFGMELGNVFTEVSFGGFIKYEVIDNQLTAFVGTQISPAGFIGEIIIKYEYREKMYQATTLAFKAIEQ